MGFNMHATENFNTTNLAKENLALKEKITELEDTLKLITEGNIDAVFVSNPSDEKFFLHESQHSVYRLIIEEMNEAALTLSEDGTILFCNRRFSDITGSPKEDILGKSIFNFIDEEQKNNLSEIIKLSSQKRCDCEIYIKSRDQKTTPLRLDLYPFPSEITTNICVIAFDMTKILEKESELNDAKLSLEKRVSERTEELRLLNKELKNGKIAALNMMQDAVEAKNELISVNENLKIEIADRIKAENNIRKSEERFRNLFEKHSAVKLMIDPKTGRIIDANEAALRFYGHSKTHLQNMFIYEINTLAADDVFRAIDEVLNKEKVFFEFRHRLADGTIRDVEVFSSKFDFDGETLLHSVIHDVTDKRIFEKQIKLHSKALENSPVSVVVTDPDGIIEYVNPKFTEVSGYSSEESIGKKSNLLKSGLEPVEKYKQMWDTIKSGEDWYGEFQNKKKNGELFWEKVLISPVKDDEGIITDFVSVKEDITEKKKMIEELIASKERAEESGKLKSQFLAQMSHEIRTPINVIIGNHSLIREFIEEDFVEEYKDIFDGIESSSRRIIRTIDLILNMAEMQTGRYAPTFTQLDLHSHIFSRLLSEFKSAVELKNLSLYYNNNLTRNNISVDEYSVMQIFANLIDNAIKYTPTGSITINLFNNHNNKTVVEITDTGIGMSEEFLKNLFQPFIQEEKGYSRTYEGNGLGLSLVKEYCKINNALIQVESEKDHGSTFRIIFNGKE